MRFSSISPLVFLFTAFALSCSSSSDTTTPPTDTGTTGDTTSDTGTKSDSSTTDSGTSDAPADTATSDTPTDTATSDAPTDTASGATLTVQNYLSWCTVSVNGGATSTNATQTVTVPPGTVVNLVADAASSAFVWDYWVGTAGDTTAAHDTNKTTTVKVTKNQVVQACCPFATPAGTPPTPCPPPTP